MLYKVKKEKIPRNTLTNMRSKFIINVKLGKKIKLSEVYKMVKTYSAYVSEYGSQYKFDKAVAMGEVYKIEEGIYSDCESIPEIVTITTKYPKAIISGEYAFYYHGLTDVIPEKYSMATRSKASKISDDRVFQIYVRDDIFDKGVETVNIDGYEVRMYDKERMLIELLRNKNTMPYDLYKEILLKYRQIIHSLQIWRIQEYADIFPKSKMIKKALDEEVM